MRDGRELSITLMCRSGVGSKVRDGGSHECSHSIVRGVQYWMPTHAVHDTSIAAPPSSQRCFTTHPGIIPLQWQDSQ
jgi:hypothetical protein